MSRFLAIVSSSLVIAVLLMSMQHKFYLSKTTIEYNRSNGMYEATIKFFTDDLEQALSTLSGHSVQISKMSEVEIDAQVMAYVLARFDVQLDQVPLNWRMVGHESENDITYCYLESYATEAFHQVTIRCDFMTELFPDQQNLFDVKAHDKTQSLVLTKERNRGTVGS